MKETKKLYKLCAKIEKRMKAASKTHEYYTIQEELQKELRKILNSYFCDWSELTKNEVLHTVSMCSSYRPQQPHSILVSVSMQYDKIAK